MAGHGADASPPEVEDCDSLAALALDVGRSWNQRAAAHLFGRPRECRGRPVEGRERSRGARGRRGTAHQQGYFRQAIDADGAQQALYPSKANEAVHRVIASELHGGGPDLRLRQELALGIRGWRLLSFRKRLVQLILAGKAHPADQAGRLVQGVDLWIDTPRRPALSVK